MEKFICVSICPELDCEGTKHCIDTKEGIQKREEKCGDYCPCGNVTKWEELKDKL